MDVNDFQEIADAALLDEVLKIWLEANPSRKIPDLQTLKSFLTLDIANIDKMLSDQLNLVMHHSEFKQLESSWRGLELIVMQPKTPNVKIKVMHASWEEVYKDVAFTLEFDQSYLFRQIYSNEYGLPGGEPFGLLVGDYYARIQGDHSIRDIDTLKGLAAIAAAAFAPIIVGVDPRSLMMSAFSEIGPRVDFNFLFKGENYNYWNQLREDDNTRYLGLALPNFLLREPHDNEKQPCHAFYFREDYYDQTGQGYCWGNASYAFASIAIKSFSETNWFYDMRDYNPEAQSGGFVRDAELFKPINETSPFLPKYSVEVLLDNEIEWAFSQLGFIPLRQVKHIGLPVFYSNKSVYKPKHYNKKIADANDEISSEIQYQLYASRFSHYIKVMIRDKVGGMQTAADISAYLNQWIQEYVSVTVPPGMNKALFPLKGADISIESVPGSPGVYKSTAYIQPHAFLEGINVDMKFATETEVIGRLLNTPGVE
ncbi:MAG: type VI secretion system contractile sheath large subunit [Gammaproteobacteria bacterium]|nr:type VI secretion system contractile sheath large subunit [Gammaproteobacteria bacterium]MCH9743692.1 type VI secretion system contractile sheath large subunit [Gammaproteobacteria bacterium]